jgi:hypothetical protein
MLRGSEAEVLHEIGPQAANRDIAEVPRGREGNSSTIAVACLDAQTMQRGRSIGVEEAASRVFNAERIATSAAFL